MWGPYLGAPLPYFAMAEGGQSSTGAALQWCRRLFSPTPDDGADRGGADLIPLRRLDEEASLLPIGSEGVCCLETFQGSRTPTTDPLARGALLGLSLRASRAHVWRACLEAVCLGTRACVESLALATASSPKAILVAGGATRSPFWLQMHSDTTGLPVVVGECADAPLLGGAILAASLRGSLHGSHSSEHYSSRASVEAATARMVHPARRIEPHADAHAAYSALYRRVYAHVAPTIAPLSRRIAGGTLVPWTRDVRPKHLPRSGRLATVMPSVLAADAGALGAAAREAQLAGATWVHVDVYDGSADVAGGALSSLGPASIRAIRGGALAVHRRAPRSARSHSAHR